MRLTILMKAPDSSQHHQGCAIRGFNFKGGG